MWRREKDGRRLEKKNIGEGSGVQWGEGGGRKQSGAIGGNVRFFFGILA